MAGFIENLGLGFLVDDEENAHMLSTIIAEQGKAIKGYYGLPYLNKHFGDAQFIMRTCWNDEEKRLEMSGVDTHCAGSCVWTVRVSGINLTPDEADKTEKRIVASKPYASGGMAPINIVNADVLPCYMKDEVIKLQIIAFPVVFDYYENEAAYEESVTDEFKGGKLLLAEGHVFPSGMLKNRNPNSEEFEQNNWMDDHVLIRGTVKRISKGRAVFEKDSFDAFVSCIIDTEFGELEIVHSFEQVKEDQREHLRVGATISGVFVLSGDPAIYEYDKGIVLDNEHNLRLLRSTFSKGDPERLRAALAPNAVYIAEYNNKTYTGPDEIIDRIRFVQDTTDEFFVYFATISSIDDGEEDLAYDVGTRCIVIARSQEKNYQSIAFMEVDDEGRISCIRTSDNSRYHFQIDESWEPETMDDDDDEEDDELLIPPEVLVQNSNYATCELYTGDYNKINKEEWEAIENPTDKSNGFFHESYYDTETHDIENAGMCLSVTELLGDRSFISIKDSEGIRRSQIIDGVFNEDDFLTILDDGIKDCLPRVCLESKLVSQGRTAIKHYIRRWYVFNVYLILSFEIVYGKHQASLTVVGDSGAFCENIIKTILNKENIQAKTDLERFERFRNNRDMSRAEKATVRAEIRYNHLMTLANCYQTGNFEALRPLLAKDCVWESQWRLDAENGRESVMAYFKEKGEMIRNSGSYPTCTIVQLVGNSRPSSPVILHEGGEDKPAPTVRLLYTEGKLCLYMEQIVNNRRNGVILDLTLNTDGLISRIDLCLPELYHFMPYQKPES